MGFQQMPFLHLPSATRWPFRAHSRLTEFRGRQTISPKGTFGCFGHDLTVLGVSAARGGGHGLGNARRQLQGIAQQTAVRTGSGVPATFQDSCLSFPWWLPRQLSVVRSMILAPSPLQSRPSPNGVHSDGHRWCVAAARVIHFPPHHRAHCRGTAGV